MNNNIQGFSEFNPKYRMTAKSYVDANIRQLIQIMNIEEEDYDALDDVKEVLVTYFTKYPDQISHYQLKTTGYPKHFNLSTNNVGGYFRESKSLNRYTDKIEIKGELKDIIIKLTTELDIVSFDELVSELEGLESDLISTIDYYNDELYEYGCEIYLRERPFNGDNYHLGFKNFIRTNLSLTSDMNDILSNLNDKSAFLRRIDLNRDIGDLDIINKIYGNFLNTLNKINLIDYDIIKLITKLDSSNILGDSYLRFNLKCEFTIYLIQDNFLYLVSYPKFEITHRQPVTEPIKFNHGQIFYHYFYGELFRRLKPHKNLGIFPEISSTNQYSQMSFYDKSLIK